MGGVGRGRDRPVVVGAVRTASGRVANRGRVASRGAGDRHVAMATVDDRAPDAVRGGVVAVGVGGDVASRVAVGRSTGAAVLDVAERGRATLAIAVRPSAESVLAVADATAGMCWLAAVAVVVGGHWCVDGHWFVGGATVARWRLD